MRKSFPILIAAMSAGLALAGSASAATNLVTNGSFESSTFGPGQLGFNTSLTGWTVAAPGSLPNNSASYDFLFDATTAFTTGSTGQYGTVALFGPPMTSDPDGGNFVGVDPAFQNANNGVSQSIGGLIVGHSYQLTFDWAAAQQTGFTGATTEGWNVTLGGSAAQSVSTSDPSHSATGWNQTILYFTADAPTDTLTFLATGGPTASQPPFALLDGVSLISVPEPTTWALMIMGFGGVGAMVRSRRRQAVVA